MDLVFRDLYDALKNTEEAFTRMDVDIDNAICGNPKCVLTASQEKLLDSYMELANVEMEFCTLDWDTAIAKMKRCFDCIDEEIDILIPAPQPEPVYTAESCDKSFTTQISVEDIKKFVIYERTYTSPTILSPIQAYVIPKDDLPSYFEPSVPEAYPSYEKYSVSWNPASNGLKVVLDHSRFPDSAGAPRGSYNISLVVAELTDEAAQAYGMTSVAACKANLLTEGVVWKQGAEFDKTVDGDWETYPAYDNTPSEVVVEYFFMMP
ncbi:hypothetical protein IAQ67_28970 (plasmid) [Paenibacillus peoriae]|uniref:Uncharacterized protein n=1 Tax=Paenibacillus peoriae TaxID=59893 RepID=A0A7H0YH31_9BACL|nr:hypothetical protein [Paenibacillus peoriae]QNR70389.1 hypothetical protein IAQ67_28970 [Paenibacillus peoriae]